MVRLKVAVSVSILNVSSICNICQGMVLLFFAAPIIDGCQDYCMECRKKFSDSFLMKNFDVNVCDGCRFVFN